MFYTHIHIHTKIVTISAPKVCCESRFPTLDMCLAVVLFTYAHTHTHTCTHPHTKTVTHTHENSDHQRPEGVLRITLPNICLMVMSFRNTLAFMSLMRRSCSRMLSSTVCNSLTNFSISISVFRSSSSSSCVCGGVHVC
jgi:hypothetical protein